MTSFSGHILSDDVEKAGNDLGKLKRRLPNIEDWEEEIHVHGQVPVFLDSLDAN